MNTSHAQHTRTDWEILAQKNKNKAHIAPFLGRYKSDEFIRLVQRWAPSREHKTILKTDLREEAYGDDEVLFSLSAPTATIIAFDIALTTVHSAEEEKRKRGLQHYYCAANVCTLPFKDNTFDLILSNSTLDHFTNSDDLRTAFQELTRVLKPSGMIILTLNNKSNINIYTMFRCAQLLGKVRYPVQFFTYHDLVALSSACGFTIHEIDYIIHIMSPINSILLTVRTVLPARIVDSIAAGCIKLAQVVGSYRKLNPLTGWFIALRCSKQNNNIKIRL